MCGLCWIKDVVGGEVRSEMERCVHGMLHVCSQRSS
jgi:hypothetical protein